MAKYELPQYQSMYRDTGAVQVNQLKRQEYLSNMQADNTLATSILNMDSMDKDDENLMNLADKYTANIDERAERKDYENLGMAIHKDSMGFVKDYTPIKRSLDLYTSYKAKIEKDYADGNINSQTRDGRLEQSKANYKGIQYTPSGTVDRDSYFKGVGYVKDVDVNAAFQTEMKDVVQREWKDSGWDLVDGNFQIIGGKDEKTGLPVWKIKRGKEVKEIPAELVQHVATSVLNRPNISASISQQADLETYNTGDVAEGQEKSAAETAIDNTISSVTKSITKEKNRKDLSKEEQAEVDKEIARLTTYRDGLISKKGTMDPTDLYKAIRFNEITNEHMSYALGKYTYRNVTTESDITLLNEEGVGSSSDKLVPSVFIVAGVNEALRGEVTGGQTVETIEKSIIDNEALLNEYATKYSTTDAQNNVIPFDLNLLYDADSEEEITALMTKMNLGEKTTREIVHKARRTRDSIDLAQKRLDEARATVYGDEWPDTTNYDAQLSEEYRVKDRFANINRPEGQGQYSGYDATLTTVSYDNISDAMKEIGLITGDQDIKHALDILLNSEVKEGEMDPDTDQVLEYPEVADDKFWTALAGEDHASISNLDKQNWIIDVRNEYGGRLQNDADRITADLTNSEIKFDAIIDNGFGDQTAETKTALHKAIKDGLHQDMQIITGGKEGDAMSFSQYIENNFAKRGDDDNYEIIEDQSGLVNVSNQQGIPMIAIAIKNTGEDNAVSKSGKISYIFIPASAIDAKKAGVSTLQTYTNSVGYKLNTLFSNGQAHNVSNWSPKMFTNVKFDYTSSTPISITIDGVTTSYNKEDGLETLEGVVKDRELERYIY